MLKNYFLPNVFLINKQDLFFLLLFFKVVFLKLFCAFGLKSLLIKLVYGTKDTE